MKSFVNGNETDTTIHNLVEVDYNNDTVARYMYSQNSHTNTSMYI